MFVFFTIHAFQRKIYHNDIFKLHSKTILNVLFTNGEILSWKSVKPSKKINLVQIPHPSKVTVKFPPPRGTTHSQMSGVCPNGRGDVEASISVVHYSTMLWPVFHFFFFLFFYQIRQARGIGKIKDWTDHIIRHFWYCSNV